MLCEPGSPGRAAGRTGLFVARLGRGKNGALAEVIEMNQGFLQQAGK